MCVRKCGYGIWQTNGVKWWIFSNVANNTIANASKLFGVTIRLIGDLLPLPWVAPHSPPYSCNDVHRSIFQNGGNEEWWSRGGKKESLSGSTNGLPGRRGSSKKRSELHVQKRVFFPLWQKKTVPPPKSLSPKVVAGKRNRDQTSKRKGAKQIDCLWKEKSPRLNFLEGRRRRHRTLWYYYFFPYQLFSFFPNAEGKGEEGGRKVLLANFLYFFFRLTNGEPKNFVFLRKKSFKKKKIAPKRSSSAMIFYSAGAWI